MTISPGTHRDDSIIKLTGPILTKPTTDKDTVNCEKTSNNNSSPSLQNDNNPYIILSYHNEITSINDDNIEYQFEEMEVMADLTINKDATISKSPSLIHPPHKGNDEQTNDTSSRIIPSKSIAKDQNKDTPSLSNPSLPTNDNQSQYETSRNFNDIESV